MTALLRGVFLAAFGLAAFTAGAFSFAFADQPLLSDDSGVARLSAADSPLPAESRIAFFGDSITMQGGYIDRIQQALEKRATAAQQSPNQLFRHGLNGGRVPTVLVGESPWGKLGGSMAELVAKEKPDLLVIYLGVNDVWHGEKGTTPEDYQQGLEAMLEVGKQAGARMIFCTPSIIGEELKGNQLNQKLGEYSEIVRRLSREHGVVLCDLHAAFLAELERVNPDNKHQGNLTYDGVHMNDAGNQLIADRLAEALCEAYGQK